MQDPGVLLKVRSGSGSLAPFDTMGLACQVIPRPIGEPCYPKRNTLKPLEALKASPFSL